MTKRVLIIAYVFPPIAYAGTHRTVRLCKYLSRLGYELHVVAIRVQRDLHNDFELLNRVKDFATIHRTATVDFWRFYNKYKRRFLKSKTGRLIDRILSLLIEVISQPDHMIFWVPFALRATMKIVKSHPVDLVYTTSPPHSQLITGFFLKRLTQVPWVADLRDPIVFNIGSTGWKGMEKSVNRFLERLMIDNCDAVITNTRAARDNLTSKFPGTRVYGIPNSFDEDDFKDLDNRKYTKFTISHLGTVYGFRNSEALFEAISMIQRSGQITPEDFEIRFYGINDNVLSATLERYNLWEYVKVYSLVEHKNALQIMNRSHMLLLLKGFSPKGLGQIPGKLFEYIGTGNPILYIGPEMCEAAEIVRETGYSYIAGKNKDNIKSAIIAEYQKYRKYKENIYISTTANKTLQKYTSREMAQRMSTILDALTLKQ